MGHKHSRDEILDAALAVAFGDGLSRLSFGRVAKRLGINDRTVVYYFPTKDELITEVLMALGTRLQETLAPAFTGPARGHLQLVRAAWPVLARPDADPVFALFFEANGLATAGQQPYGDLVPHLVEQWIAWAAEFIEGDDDLRRTEAAAAIALLDGLLLLRQLAGPAVVEGAAARLGVA